MAEQERIQKILARAGIASRRKAEELIVEGSVTVNGKPAKLGDKATFGRDAIKVNGKLLQTTEPPVYLAFHKPRSVISMMGDPEGRPSLTDYLSKVKTRLFPIGRLDFNSEGLILLTNDGDFAEKLHKKDDVVRVYHIKVRGHPAPEAIERLRKGGRLGDRRVSLHSVRLEQSLSSKARIEVAILGGSAVDLKAYFELKGLVVDRIVRTAIGHITLHGLESGKFRLLKFSQVEALLKQPELGMRRLEEAQTETPAPSPKIVPRTHAPVRITPVRSPIRPKIRPVDSREGAPRPGKRPGGRFSRAGAPGGGPGRRPARSKRSDRS